MGFYDFEAESIRGKDVKMSEYAGKVVLVVNSATHCGFTPQYDDLQRLYEKYSDQGFDVLEFPCNQFENQAPESDAEIAVMCDARFGLKFSRFVKVDVNGETAHPLFLFLQKEKGFEGFHPEHPLTPMVESKLERLDPDYRNKPDIKWNFTKFLIDREGNVVARFEPTTFMEDVEKAISELL